jgi:hypothetical protein
MELILGLAPMMPAGIHGAEIAPAAQSVMPPDWALLRRWPQLRFPPPALPGPFGSFAYINEMSP